MRCLSTADDFTGHENVSYSIINIPTPFAKELKSKGEIYDMIKNGSSDILGVTYTGDGRVKLYSDPPIFSSEDQADKMEELEDRLSEGEVIFLPDDYRIDLPNEVDYDRSILHITDGGFFWTCYFDNILGSVETQFISWEELEEVASQLKPISNLGRTFCWWCGTRVDKQQLFTSVIEHCRGCGK